MRGSTVPRLFTPPLVPPGPSACPCGECGLTPDNSYGFDVVEFAREDLDHPLDPWQEFTVIHAGELYPNGLPRFRVVVIEVARQNGKTEIPVVLSLYWQFACQIPLVLGTSTKLDYAKESWLKAVKLAEKAPGLPVTRNDRKRWTRQTNGEQESWFAAPSGDDCRYKIAASNEEGGRSLTVHRLVLDELRQHKTYAAWGASVPAGNAVRDFQVIALSNAGDSSSVVLADKRKAALKFIETGQGDERLGLFEWSSPDDASPLDVAALAMANPNLGHRIDPQALLGEARTAVEQGGEALATFRTECMCHWVVTLTHALDLEQWKASGSDEGLGEFRDRIAVVFDASPDGSHATLVAAAKVDEEAYRVEVVHAWDGPTAVVDAQRDLPAVVARVAPQTFGWFPNGPAAAAMATLKERRERGWPPPGTVAAEITTEAAAACMGLISLVKAGQVQHPHDPLLNSQVEAAEPLRVGDRVMFSRKGEGTVDAVYAMAGAIHLARTLQPVVSKLTVLRSSRRR